MTLAPPPLFTLLHNQPHRYMSNCNVLLNERPHELQSQTTGAIDTLTHTTFSDADHKGDTFFGMQSNKAAKVPIRDSLGNQHPLCRQGLYRSCDFSQDTLWEHLQRTTTVQSSSIEERDTRIVDDLLCLPVAKGTRIYQQKKKRKLHQRKDSGCDHRYKNAFYSDNEKGCRDDAATNLYALLL
ncbi:predicted protein [Lichtheimia corymbifera JMRC:FSU:9682]|uniref:Uncharacterized protein n=1 Tax=Lichtheimia corymbifera JMRC:FSU:9682 TaxID=1263082 RepID=A0A068S5R7_9FUNG|nr:predicted protein [Lichtheimia corymbifera JMRC:FSU:9682]